MTPETEVISCPACKHLLRVPADWLGTQVQCPECRAMFKAPVRDGDRLTDPELVSAPTDSPPAPRRGRLDPMLLIPAFGLLLVGVSGLVVNCYQAAQFHLNPEAAKEGLKAQFAALRQAGFGKDDPEDEREKLDAERADKAAGALRVALPVFAAVSAGAFAGGLAMALRRGYRVAVLGCVLAPLNVVGLCCVPGGVFGLWGLVMLLSAEGREHFRRA
jgi:hypothetical protein